MRTDLNHGAAGARVAALGVPIALAMGLQTCFAFVDLVFVGMLGEVALAGLGAGMQIAYAIYALAQVLGVPALADVGHAWGHGDERRVRRLVGTYLACAAGLGAAAALALAAGSTPIAAALAPDEASRIAARSYLSPLALTAATQSLLLVASGVLRAAGDAKTPLLALMVSVGTNIALDALFIFGFGPVPALGLAGAAWATVAAQTVGVLLLVGTLLRREAMRPARPRVDRALVRSVLGTGVPAAAQFAIFAALLFVLLIALQPAGAAWTGGVAAGFRILQQGMVPFIAVGTAGAAVAAQAAGAGRAARVDGAIRAAVGLALAVGLVLALAFRFGGEAMAGALLEARESVAPCARFLEGAAWALPALAFATSFTFTLQGLHRPWPVLTAAFVRSVAFAGAAAWTGARPDALIVAFAASLWLEAVLGGSWVGARMAAAARERRAQPTLAPDGVSSHRMGGPS